MKYDPGRPRLKSITHGCATAALVYCVFSVCVESAAIFLQKSFDSEDAAIENFKVFGDLVQRSRKSKNQCLVLRDPELQFAIQSAIRRAAFDALEVKNSGVYIVSIR